MNVLFNDKIILPVHPKISLGHTCIDTVPGISCHMESEQRDRQC